MKTGRAVVTPLILAAGASSRMGTPKAILQYQGMTFLDRLIETCGRVSDTVVVVVGFHAQEICSGVNRRAHFVTNPEPALGQLSSLQCGLAAITGAAMFLPVDLPAIHAATVEAIVEAFALGNYPVAAPRYNGKHGHPVCISRQVVEELLALPSTGKARDVIRKYRPETLFIDVEDPGVIYDIDTPLEYETLVGASQ